MTDRRGPCLAPVLVLTLLSWTVFGAGSVVAVEDPLAELDALLRGGRASSESGPRGSVQAPRIGHVDLLTLVMLHPSMRTYRFESGTFERPFPEGLDEAGRRRVMRERLEARRRAWKQRRSTMDDLLQRRYQASLELGRLKADMNERLYKAKQELATRPGEMARRAETIEREYWQSRKDALARFDDLNAQILALQDEADSATSLSRTERSRKLAAIEREVLEAVGEAARALGCTVVLNTSSEPLRDLPSTEVTPASEPPPAAAAFREFEETENLYDTFWKHPIPRDQPHDEVLAHLGSLVDQWLHRRDEFGGAGDLISLRKVVLGGSVDLTLDALERVLKRHRMPGGKIRMLVEALEAKGGRR